MIEKLKLVNNNQEKEYSITLHTEVTDILFEHRRHVKNTFLQIKGHYEIAYFGINIINHSLPQLNSKAIELNTRSTLKLIVNNSESWVTLWTHMQ